MTPEERARLIEASTTAWRPRLVGRIDVHPAWFDLDEAARKEAFEETSILRKMEAALDPEGLSTTGHAVLARIRQVRR